MSKLLLTFYGDDFTGSTDALEQLTNAGIRAALFIEPPTKMQLARFKNLQAIGVAGKTRSLAPVAMERELRPAFQKLKKLGAPHIHYKVCSTFDSSPQIGSIGRAIDVAVKIFSAPFIPLLVAAPALGRYTVFGNHFARFGIGSGGEIHRLDRHPAISKHPVTPMLEADLRLHLAKQTKKKIALFDILKISLPENEGRAALKKILAGKPEIVLFDALSEEHLLRIGKLLDECASVKRPLFSVGSSGIEMALAAHYNLRSSRRKEVLTKKSEIGNRKSEMDLNLLTSAATNQLLVGSGSCSPVTQNQIARALKNGFAEVALDAGALVSPKNSAKEIQRAADSTVSFLVSGRSVMVHTTSKIIPFRNVTASRQSAANSEKWRSAESPLQRHDSAKILGTALGKVLRGALAQTRVQRLCIAGGDTSSFAARALGIEALEMIAPLTPGAPLCRAFAPNSPADKLEFVFKGGQVGAENYFETIRTGKNVNRSKRS